MPDHESRGSAPDSALPDGLRQPLEGYLLSKGKGQNNSSGTYRRHAERELRNFAAYLVAQGISDLEEIDAVTLRNYVRDELLGEGYSPTTVRKYYDYVSAWIGWAQREGLVAEHYGIQKTAHEPLPDTDTRTQQRQQTWYREERQQFLTYLDERAHEAIDDRGTNAYKPVRDRALAYLLAYTGVRGGELLTVRDDERRTGATWRDLGDEKTSLTVLGKTQKWETRSIPPQARPAIERWERIFDPEPDWPIVPTFHRPSLYDQLPEAVDSDDFGGFSDVFEALREHGRCPPALTTDGARRLFRRLTDAAEIDVEEDYLQLHGARRGVGRVLAMQQGADAAADQLGNSVAVVEESYSEILAEERAEATGEAFEEHDED